MLNPAALLIVATADTDQIYGLVGCGVLVAIVAIPILAIGAVLGAMFGGKKCTVCETRIKRKYYRWKIDGKKEILCPACNRRMESRQSSAKFSRRFR